MQRRALVEHILDEALPIKEQLAELARMSNIAFNFQVRPESDQLQRDFFPFSLVPLQIRQDEFEELRNCQLSIQKLFLKTSEDKEFVNKVLAETAKADTFAAKLLQLYNETCEHTKNERIKFNIIRSDFMKDGPDGGWKLIEFNAMSPGSATTCERVQQMNSFLSDTIMKIHYDPLKQQGIKVLSKLNYIETLQANIEAWKQYGNPKAIILMVYEGLRQNINDEKEIENVFVTAGARAVQADFNTMHSRLRVDELGTLFYEGDEVALVHYRAGLLPDHYLHETTWEARKKIELSRAVKLPTIGMQLVNFKRVQLDLCTKQVLDRYLPQEESNRLLRHFVPMWSFENEAEQEKVIGLCRASPKDYVLKPNLEGGGNNIYNENLVEVLERSTPLERKKYVLMKKIRPYLNHTVMFRRKLVECSDVITELGIFGGILSVDNQIIRNVTGGCLLKSKVPTSEDGGVVAGFAVFDCLMIAP